MNAVTLVMIEIVRSECGNLNKKAKGLDSPDFIAKAECSFTRFDTDILVVSYVMFRRRINAKVP